MSDFIVSDLRSEPWFLLQYAVFKVPSSLLPDFWKPVKCIKDFIVCQPLFRLTFDRVFCQMETERFELLTPCLQGRCSPNWATPPLIRRPPTLPCRLQHSTIGRLGLNHRVRDGNGCYPQAHRHRNVMLLTSLECKFSSHFIDFTSKIYFSAISPHIHP